MLPLLSRGFLYHIRECLLKASGWTREVNRFLQWLRHLSFGGGGFGEAGIAKVLSDALMANYNHQAAEYSINDLKNPRYLILLSEYFTEARAALNQHELKCKSMHEGLLGLELETGLMSLNPDSFSDEDAMMLQQISHEPLASQHENLAGNNPVLPNREKENIDDDEDVVIFREILNELATSEHEISAGNIPSATALLTKGKEKLEDDDDIMMLWEALSESLTSQQQFSTKDFPTTAEKVEPDAAKSKDPGAAFQQCSHVPHSTFKSIPNGQTSSNFFSSQGRFDDTKLEITPTGIVLSQKIRPGSVASVNASLLSNPPRHQMMNSTAITGIKLPEPQTIGSEYKSPQQTIWSLIVNSEKLLTTPRAQYATNGFIASAVSTISGKSKVSQPEGPQKMSSFTQRLYQTMSPTVKSESSAKTPRGAGRNTTGLLISATSNIYGNLNISQPLANHQGPIGNSQSLPLMTLGHFSGTQMAQDEHSLKRKHFDTFGQPSISYGAGTRVPMVGKSQRVQGGMESFVVSNTLCCKTLSQQATGSLPEGPPKGYIKAWEGDLTSKENGQTVFVTRLMAYSKMSTSDM
ncbi:hypothetical protein F0562_025216 [Nyssa sinensis]|uniref:Mediator of RNA polymerase II transcription subunit 25 n=1 Tax=Nyssa sinensis TaxID=561372 RepID=A0A5J5BHC4_9ASTE|nr:hypothetical protein F0562_025216 [Nyssa sinensis]